MSGYMRNYENIINDFIQKEFTDSTKASDKIVFVLISQNDLSLAQDRYKMGWPWKREFYGKVVHFLKQAGAKLIIFDILFTEKSIHRIMNTPSTEYTKDDLLFAKSIGDSNNVIIPYYFTNKKTANSKNINNLSISMNNHNKMSNINNYNNIILPINILLNKSLFAGMINSSIDKDHTFRRMPILARYNNHYYPSLSLAALIKYFNIKQMSLENDILLANNRKIPLDKQTNVRLKFYGTNDIYKDYYMMNIIQLEELIQKIYPVYNKLNIIDKIKYKDLYKNPSLILDISKKIPNQIDTPNSFREPLIIPSIPKNAFLNKIVLIGSIVPGSSDHRPTPFNSKEVGLHLHATLIDNYINNDFLIEYRENSFILILIILFSLGTSIGIYRIPFPWKYILSILFMTGIFILMIILFKFYNIIMDSFTLNLAILFPMIGVAVLDGMDHVIDRIYKNLVISSPVGIVTQTDDKIHLANNAMMEILGIQDEKEIINKSIKDFVHPKDYAKLQKTLDNLQKSNNKEKSINEIRLIHSNHRKIYTTINLQSFEYKKNHSIQIVVKDITEQKRIEKLREDTERLVRHDLKNPLAGIMGFAELLKRKLKGMEKELTYVESIRECGDQILYLINHSLDLFKMDEGTYQLVPAEVDIIKILKKIQNNVNDFIVSKQLHFKCLKNNIEISENEFYHIDGEELYIEILLHNLIKNAIEASPENNTITINIMEDNNFALIDIHNMGIIPEKIRDYFFERYTTSGKKGGTGVGTYSSKLIAKTHHGDITFTTSKSEGTHLVVKLPISQ